MCKKEKLTYFDNESMLWYNEKSSYDERKKYEQIFQNDTSLSLTVGILVGMF